MQALRDFMRKNNQPLGKLPALGFKKGMTSKLTVYMYNVVCIVRSTR